MVAAMSFLELFRRAASVAVLALPAALIGCGTIVPTLPPPVVDASPAAAKPVEPAASAAPAAKPAPAAPSRSMREPADAVPRVERIAPGYPNRPYEIRGESFDPENSDVPMREVGIASWYGVPFHGRVSSSGERYDMNQMTAAHPTMPLPSYALVRNLGNGRQVVVRVNDRGPFHGGRIIDLSRAAARKLRIGGTALVEVQRLTHDDIRTGAWRERHATDLAASPSTTRSAARRAAPGSVPTTKVATREVPTAGE
jgi:rare lipoprotein A